MSDQKQTPDNVTPTPHSLPYASNVGAPAIKPDSSLSGWKQSAVHAVNKHYEDRYNDLKKQFEAFADEFKWNSIMFDAEMRIKPVVGKVYHLYHKGDSYYVSLFSPDERVGGYDNYVASLRLNYDNRWEKVD